MAQYYLLSSKSKNINLKDILRLTEEDAFHLLKTHRWGNPNNVRDVCCPHCGIRHKAYFLPSRKRWCCKHCKRHFYITTNTAFAFHKVDLVDILAAILMMVNSSKGISSIDVSRHLNLNYKTAFVLCGKVRETLFKTRDLSSLSGEIHEDGMWINFTLRPTNFRINNVKKPMRKVANILNLERLNVVYTPLHNVLQMIVIYLEQIVPLSQWITPKMLILFLH